VKFEDTYTK